MAEIALIGLAVAGGGLSASSSISAGESQGAAFNTAADASDRDADQILAQSRFRGRQEKIKGEELIDQGVAIAGASGTKVNRGSNLRLREVNQERLETSIQNILFSGKVTANKLRNQAAQNRANSKNARTAGTIGAVTSIIQTAATVGAISSNFSIIDKLQTQGVAGNVASSVVPRIPL